MTDHQIQFGLFLVALLGAFGQFCGGFIVAAKVWGVITKLEATLGAVKETLTDHRERIMNLENKETRKHHV